MQQVSRARLDALRKAGLEVKNKRGMFLVSKGTSDMPLIEACDKAQQKFITRYEKERYILEGRPKVRKIPLVEEEEYRPVLNKGGNVLVWIPKRQKGMRSDHPWYVEDDDQYEVTAWFYRPAQTVKIEISDDKYRRLVAQHRMPAGVKVA